jgi:hypothetical protein
LKQANASKDVSQEGNYKEAGGKYSSTMKITGYQPELAYYVALCHYQMKQYVQALKFIADIIERGIRDHPGTLERMLTAPSPAHHIAKN